MSRIRNVQQVLFLPLDNGLEDPTCMMHPQLRASIEDVEINFYLNDVHCTTSPMTETCSFSYFNRELNVCRSEINDCLRASLEKGNEANNNDYNFMCKAVLLMLGKVMIKEKIKLFYFDCNRQETVVLTRCKMKQHKRMESDFEKKWDEIFKEEDHLHGNLLEWFETLCCRVKSIDVKNYSQ